MAADALNGFTDAQCAALNHQRLIDTHRTHQVTKSVMCDTRPAACVSEFLFAHEFYWSEKDAEKRGGVKCRKWGHDGWPTREPHVRPEAPRDDGLWPLLQLLPNKTLWLHGDSITTQLCEASICSLLRAGVAPQPPFCAGPNRHPSTAACTDVEALERASKMQLRAVRLPNGARLLCSAVGVFEPDKVAQVLEIADVAMFNYGLHYHSAENFGAATRSLFEMLRRWAAARAGRVPLYREQSAQHFKGGSWSPGAHRTSAKLPPGTPCECEPLGTRAAAGNTESVAHNQNRNFNNLALSLAAEHGVGAVPFFNLTAVRHDMHRRHFCSYSNQQVIGRCCDCTHWCYTPQFWDVFFRDMRLALVAHPSFVPPPLAAAAGRRGRGGRGRGGARWAFPRVRGPRARGRSWTPRRWAEMRP